MLWFARHELRLAWHDALATLRAGRRRGWWLPVAFVGIEAVLHALAYEVLEPLAPTLRDPDIATLITATGTMVLMGTLFLSQAMETATRGFYARADLDLILSSPAPARRIFAVRIGAIALTTIAMAVLVSGPAIDAMALLAGPRFLAAYGVLVALGAVAAAAAVCLTAFMFRVIGAKRTRLVAQIVAAVIGAGFVVGVQAVAILNHGTLSRLAMFRSPEWIAAAPAADSILWWPIRAATGDGLALVAILAIAVGFLVVTMGSAAEAFARGALSVAGIAPTRAGRATRAAAVDLRSPAASLRRKEWVLLRRDPWLVSQSLMQVLYLVPPALMLWHSYGSDIGNLVILVPVVVMAAGQLAGGLAWLAISGEDAPDLVMTAPITSRAILRAKIEVVALAIAIPLLPLVGAMAFAAPYVAAVTIVGVALAAAAASAVQYIFRVKGKRANFRRRQTASRIATFAEAFVSISVAAAAGLAAAGIWLAVVPIGVAAAVLLASRAIAEPTT